MSAEVSTALLMHTSGPEKLIKRSLHAGESAQLPEFDFRGQRIVTAAIKLLLANHDLTEASEILLAGPTCYPQNYKFNPTAGRVHPGELVQARARVG